MFDNCVNTVETELIILGNVKVQNIYIYIYCIPVCILNPLTSGGCSIVKY